MKKLILIFFLIPNILFASSMKMIGEKGKLSQVNRTIEIKIYDNYFNDLNQEITYRLKEVNTLRIGAEILANKFSFRGGYMIEDSPYKSLNNEIPDIDNNIDESTSGFSLGLGYKMNQSTVDLSFVKLNKSKYKRLYDTGLTNQVNLKSDNTPVTNIDIRSSELIVSYLSRTFKGDTIISEESDDKSNKKLSYWLVDPIDGTKNYIKGGEQFCICISYIHIFTNVGSP